MNNRVKLKKVIKTLVEQVIKEKTTAVDRTWAGMMESLSGAIKKPIVLDDAGNYNICECEPHHISLRPIVHDVFDLLYIKDGVERQKVLFVPFEDVEKYVKEWLNSKELNYVDNEYDRCVENSKDKEGGKKADKQADDLAVDPEKDYAPVKNIKAEDENPKEDDPTEPMRPAGKFERQIDYKSKKPNYEPPKLPKNLNKLVVKYSKLNGKPRK